MTMEGIQNIMREIDTQPFEVNTGHQVYILHINNPHDFYVRNTKYTSVVQKIENLKYVPRAYTVKIDQIVLFNMTPESRNCRYARGKVISIQTTDDSTLCDIFAIDYGFIEKNVPLVRLFDCDQLLVVIPPLAFKCQLANCAQRGGSWEKATEAFKTFVAHESQAKMTIDGKISDKLLVTLYNSYPDDISTMLALTDFTTLGFIHNAVNKLEPVASVPRIILPSYTFKDLQQNAQLRVKVLSRKNYEEFLVADVNDLKEYLAKRQIITQYAKKQSKCGEGALNIGDVICVRDYLNLYERGLIKEVLDKKRALVYFVDKGTEAEVHHINMRMMPQQCLSTPVVAIYCKVRGNLETSLRSLIYPGNEIIITIEQLGRGFDTPHTVNIAAT